MPRPNRSFDRSDKARKPQQIHRAGHAMKRIARIEPDFSLPPSQLRTEAKFVKKAAQRIIGSEDAVVEAIPAKRPEIER